MTEDLKVGDRVVIMRHLAGMTGTITLLGPTKVSVKLDETGAEIQTTRDNVVKR